MSTVTPPPPSTGDLDAIRFAASASASDRKPGSVLVVQVAGFIAAAASAALIPMLLWRMVDLMEARGQWNSLGLDAGESDVSALELARTEFAVAFGVVLAIPPVLGILALITAFGLQIERRWARIIGAIWAGALLLPVAAWAAGSVLLFLTTAAPDTDEFNLGPLDPIALNAIAAPAGFVAVLLVFVLLLTRRVRRWTPKPARRP